MEISERAMLVRLSIRGVMAWEVEDRRLSAETAERHNIQDPRTIRAMKKNLDPRKVPSLAAVVNAAGALRSFHYEMTLPWQDGNVRILPSAAYFDYTTGVAERKDKVLGTHEAFLRDLPELEAEARVRLNDLYRKEEWPDPDDLRKRLRIRTQISPLADPSDFRISMGQDEKDQLKQGYAEELHRNVATAVASSFNRFRAFLTGTDKQPGFIERLRRYETKDGKVTHTFKDSVVTELREIVALSRKLNFTADPTLTKIADEIDRELCQREPQVLRDDYIQRREAIRKAEGFARSLEAIDEALGQQAA